MKLYKITLRQIDILLTKYTNKKALRTACVHSKHKINKTILRLHKKKDKIYLRFEKKYTAQLFDHLTARKCQCCNPKCHSQCQTHTDFVFCFVFITPRRLKKHSTQFSVPRNHLQQSEILPKQKFIAFFCRFWSIN